MKNLRKNLLLILLVCLAVTLTVALSSCNIFGGGEEIPTGHQHPLTAVAEVKATCTENGTESYYICSECNKLFADAEGSVEIDAPKVIEKTDHDYKKTVYPNSCTEAGYTKYTCFDCDYSYNGDEVAAKDHTPAEAVKENVINVTCNTDGSYDSVVYCSECNEKISSESVTVKATGEHVYSIEQERVEVSCEADGYVIKACGCGETQKISLGSATGHSFGEWTVATAPTYETEGKLSKTCGNCSGTEEKNIGIISADNGYKLVIAGVLSRWTYTIDEQTFTFDITETVDTNTYSATNGTPWCVGTDASGALVKLDGYKTTNASWDGTNLSFGGSGMTYYTTVTSPKATTVTLIINCARNKAKPFFADSATEHCIDDLMVNGSTDGVICYSDAQLTVTGWHAYTDYAIATLFLKEGDNLISFKSATTVNFKGIGFISTEALHIHADVVDVAVAPTCLASGLTEGVHCSECNKVLVAQESVPTGGHSWSDGYTVLTAPTYTAEGSMVKKCAVCDITNEEIVTMPIVSAENGYTQILEGVISRWEYSYNGESIIVDIEESKEFDNYFFSANDAYNTGLGSHNSTYNEGGYFGDTSGDVFTAVITVPEATSVNFIICGGTKDTRSYSGETIINSLTVNGKSDGVILTTELTKFEGWTTWVEFHAATLYLEEGVNTITFSLSANLNIAGISFDSAKEISLVRDYVDVDFMSFNIRQDTDSGVKAWANRKDALIQIIINANPSVVCFQEVKQHQYEDIAAGLADYTVLYYGRGGSTTEGLAIAYKSAEWNEISRQRFWLSETPDVESKGWGASYLRIAVNVLLQHKATNQYLNVFTVHLDFSDTPKQKGMELIVSKAAEMNAAAGIEYPTLIAGDYNDGIGGVGYNATLGMCNDVRYCAPTTDFYTTCAMWGTASDTNEGGIIDHIFVSKKHFASIAFEVPRVRDESGFYPSDHWAVIGKVALLIPHTHTEVVDAAVAADCTNTGLTEGKHCSTCGEVLVAQTVVDALGHTEAIDAAVAADCLNTGLTEGKHCSVCNEVLVAQDVVDALGHTEAVDEAKAPSCVETGLTEGKHCSVCKEVLVAQTVVDATGHTYDDDLDESCNNCDFVRDVSCQHNEKVAIGEAKAATCTEAGITAGEKCAECGEVFSVQETISALGHTEVVDAAVAADCTNTGLTEGKHCSVCNEVLVAQTVVDALGHTEVVDAAVAADCTNTGLTEGKHCSVCNEVLVAQNAVDALGHTNAAAVRENEVTPTFDAAGSFDSVVYCSVCSAEISRVTTALPALNFTDYTSATTASGSTVTTTFTYNSADYSTSLVTDDYLTVNGIIYSRYELEKLCGESATVTYDTTSGYTYHGSNEHTISGISVYGQSLTITGTLTVDTSTVVSISGGNLIIGTDSVSANVTINSSIGNSITFGAGEDMTVAAGSTLNLPGSAACSIRASSSSSSTKTNINVYGTITTVGQISFNRYHVLNVYAGGSVSCASFNNGKYNNINVTGSLTVSATITQTDSSKMTINEGGVVKVTQNLAFKTGTLTVNGNLEVGGNVTGISTFTVGATGRCYVTGTSNTAPTVTEGGYAKIGETEYGTAPASSTETE